MRRVKITPENLPTDTPVYDGTRYYCRNWDCYEERRTLKECGVIPTPRSYYIPILRCSECGRLYFGNYTPIPISAPMPAEISRPKPTPKPAIKREDREQPHDIILPQLITV